jgi:imidazole glycerol-phosphate synthase subunit HisH
VTVSLVDYGAGNLTSVTKAFREVGALVTVVTEASGIESANAIVVPGVGHFAATAPLDDRWRAAIRARLDRGAALLGICLGLQWLFEGSAEAPDMPGLGLFPGRCTLLPGPLKVPHVGWNVIERTAAPSRLLDEETTNAYAYFTHSYAAPIVPHTVARTEHGVPFSSVVERDRVFGAQFHPEKSAATGLRLLSTFLRLAGDAR